LQQGGFIIYSGLPIPCQMILLCRDFIILSINPTILLNPATYLLGIIAKRVTEMPGKNFFFRFDLENSDIG